jgi:hypothetical protein
MEQKEVFEACAVVVELVAAHRRSVAVLGESG